ncbi:MAG: hypothetical protein ABEI97_05035 [Candidatus Nanohaloarchaea archaeon]
MAFYDSVKEDIRDETGAAQDDDEEGSMPFDQLKDEAEEREDPEETEASSDTDIEVLGDGDLDDTDSESEAAAQGSSAAAQPEASTAPAPQEQDAEPGGEQVDDAARDAADRDTVQVLQRIEQQNQEMLDVLRGIKRSLE